MERSLVWFGGPNIVASQEKEPLFSIFFPQALYDLEGGEGFSLASGHNQQHALLNFGNKLNAMVDGHALVIARFAAAFISVHRVKRLLDEFDRLRRNPRSTA